MKIGVPSEIKDQESRVGLTPQSVQELIVDEEISVGNYILSGGEIPAMTIADSLIRLIPNVLGSSESTLNETFSEHIFGKNKEPVYTKPRIF